jgi:hypothetical protein
MRQGQRKVAGLVLLQLLLVISAVAAQTAPSSQDVHVVFLTDCTSYSDWQTIAATFSWRESGQVQTVMPLLGHVFFLFDADGSCRAPIACTATTASATACPSHNRLMHNNHYSPGSVRRVVAATCSCCACNWQAGPLSKAMCCTPEEARNYNKKMLGVVKTHIAPSYAVHPKTGGHL